MAQGVDDKPPIDGSAPDIADRPRQRIPRDQAIDLLNRVYDALETCDQANDPEIKLRHENNAFDLARKLHTGMSGDLQARRNAAAAISRTVIEPQVWIDATVDAGHRAIDPVSLSTPIGAMRAQHVISRMPLDNAEMLPPGLAHHTALALYEISLGERNTWLHRAGKGGPAHAVAMVELVDTYYHAGFHNLSLPAAAAKLFPDNSSRWPTLETFRTRNADLIAVCEQFHGVGIADANAGRPYSRPLAAAYTIEQIEALRLGTRKKHPRKRSK